MYGLEVCKSLYLPETFLETAHMIRNKYHPTTRGELSHISTKYNSQKIRGICEVCNIKLGEEIHHIREQQESNEKGFIDTFHKNHPANLISICQKCHDEIHSKNNGTQQIRKIKTTNGYKLLSHE
jgi:5-methylcytosine-specific restriction endonuclease McrA